MLLPKDLSKQDYFAYGNFSVRTTAICPKTALVNTWIESLFLKAALRFLVVIALIVMKSCAQKSKIMV